MMENLIENTRNEKIDLTSNVQKLVNDFIKKHGRCKIEFSTYFVDYGGSVINEISTEITIK